MKKELHEKLLKLRADCRELNDKNPEFSQEDQRNYDATWKEAEELQTRIAREIQLEAAEKEDREREREILASNITPPAASDDGDSAEKRTVRVRNGLGSHDREVEERGSAEYEKNFANYLQVGQKRALQADADEAGGFTFGSEQFVAKLIQAVDDQVFIRQLATVQTVTNAQTLGAPSLDADPADADWTSELAIGSTDTTMDFGKRELTPHPLGKLIKISRKLIRNSALGIESLVIERLGYKFGITQEKGFLSGHGSGQPLGVFTASADGIPTSRDVSTGNSTSAFTFDGLKEVKYSVKGAYWGRAQWIFHRDAVKMAAKLKDGEGRYQWVDSIVAGEPDRLLGFPVNMSEYAPNTFTTGLYVGILGDFSNYWVADALSMGIQRLDELYAAANRVGFIGRLESDGAPVLSEAFARVKLA